MWREITKTGLSYVLRGCAADRLIGRLSGKRRLPVVLGYHRVVEDFHRESQGTLPSMLISRRMLERHLEWLGRRFQFVSLDAVADALEAGREMVRPSAVLTFDDGYRDAYEIALPLLRAKGIPAAFFVVTNLVGTDRLQIYDHLYLLLARGRRAWGPASPGLSAALREVGLPEAASESICRTASPYQTLHQLLDALPQSSILRLIRRLEEEIPLEDSAIAGLRSVTWEMLDAMQATGMTIASHTCSHALLTSESWQTVVDEASASRDVLTERLGRRVDYFAYPGGRFDGAVVRAIAQAGYRLAFTTCQHRSAYHPLLTVPRRLLWEKSCVDLKGQFSGSVMSCQINGIFDSMIDCEIGHAGRVVPSLAAVGAEA